MAFKRTTDYSTESGGEGSRKVATVDRLVAEGTPMVDHRLSSPDNNTLIRVIPAWDPELKEVLDPLDPEGYAKRPGKRVTVFDQIKAVGVWATLVDVASFLHGDTYYQLAQLTTPEDAGGSPSPRNGLMRSFMEGAMKLKGVAGAPPEWAEVLGSTKCLRWPQRRLYIQCMAKVVDGAPVESETGYTEPSVMVLSKAATEALLRQACDRELPNEPLGLENNKLGDFYSPEEGCLLEIYRSDSGGEEEFPAYNVRKSARREPLPVDKIARWFRPWNEILHPMTPEAQFEELTGILPDTLVAAAVRDSDWGAYVSEELAERTLRILHGGAAEGEAGAPAGGVPERPAEEAATEQPSAAGAGASDEDEYNKGVEALSAFL